MQSFLLLIAVLANAAARRVVVVGAGWGGLGAAQALSKEPGIEVTVVDAGAGPAAWCAMATARRRVGLRRRVSTAFGPSTTTSSA